MLAAKDNGLEWEQWTLEDSGRAELPLMVNEETYPLGMALDSTSQREILVSETTVIPPKPILYLLSTGGILCSYYMISDTYQGPLVKAPEPFDLVVGVFKTTTGAVAKIPSQPNATPQPANFPKENLLPKFNETSNFSATFASRTPLSSQFPSFSDSGAAAMSALASAHTASPVSSLGSITAGKPIPSSTQVGSITSGTPVPNVTFWKPHQPSAFPPTPTAVTFPPPVPPNAAFLTTVSQSPLTKPMPLSQTQHFPIKPTALTVAAGGGIASSGFSPIPKPPSVSSSSKPDPTTSPSKMEMKGASTASGLPRKMPGQTALVTAFYEELSKFGTEVVEVKKRAHHMAQNVTTDKEDYIVAQIEQLRQFVEKAKKTTKIMNVDIHTLRGTVLDVFAASEEGRSLENRTKDKCFVHLLKSRGLDPLSAKKMREIRTMFYYLENQVAEVNSSLDRLWGELQSTQKCGVAQMPNMELIYRSMTTNHNIACNLKQKMERLDVEVSQVKASIQPYSFLLSGHEGERSTSYASFSPNPILQSSLLSEAGGNSAKRGSPLDDLGPLSDVLMNSGALGSTSTSRSSAYNSKKTLSREKETLLRSMLEKRPVTRVRPPSPTVEYSRLISPVANLKEKMEDRLPPGENGTRPSPGTLPPNFSSLQTSVIGSSVSSFHSKPEKRGLYQDFVPEQSFGAFVAPATTLPTTQQRISETSHKTGFSLGSLLAGTTPVPTHSSSFTMSTNIFTLAATASKEDSPFQLKIGGITLESKPKPDTSRATAKAPILSSLLERPPLTHGANLDGAVAAKPAFTFFGAKVASPPPPSTSTTAKFQSATVPSAAASFTCTTPTGQDFSFNLTSGTSVMAKSSTPSLQSFKFSTPIPAKITPLKSEENKVIDNESVFEDVTPPFSPRGLVITEQFVLGEPQDQDDDDEEYEVEEEEEEEEDWVVVEERNKEFDVQDAQTEILDVPENANSALALALSTSSSGLGKDVSLLTSDAEALKATSTSLGMSVFTSPSSALLATTALPALSTGATIGATTSPAAGATITATTVEFLSTKTELQGTDSGTDVGISSPTQNVSDSFQFTLPTTAASAAPATTTTSTTMSTTTASAVPFSFTSLIAATVTAATTDASKTLSPSAGPASFLFSFPPKTVSAGTLPVPADSTNTSGTVTSAGDSVTQVTVAAAPLFSSAATSQSVSEAQTSFVQSATTSGTSTTSDTASAAASMFGVGAGKPVFGGQAFSFAQPGGSAFGSAPGSAFAQAKPVFGQSVFGQTQQQTSATTFGQQSAGTAASSGNTGGVFGQSTGGFFSDLGAKPSPENANKNIFGSITSFGAAPTSANLFGGAVNQESGAFWGKPPNVGGAFAGSGFSSGSSSVGQTGFGGFQQSPTKTGAFGGNSAFGSSPTFGGAPTFGGVAQMGNRVFGSPVAPAPSFASFATNDAPTFGSLAAQTSIPTFGSLAQQPAAPPQFGVPAPPTTPPTFGAVTPVFGGSLGFGSQTTGQQPAQQGSPSFSQWRS